MSTIDYERLVNLGDKVRAGDASKKEKDEFMDILHRDGKISDKMYNDYKTNESNKSDTFLDTALAIGAILLLGYVIGELFKGKTK